MNKRKLNKERRSNEDQPLAAKLDCPDDADIAYYAKKLRLKSRREKGIPQEFYSDGLGEILEFIEAKGPQDYEKLKLDEEAPEEVSQREFQLFPKRTKDRGFQIPSGKRKFENVLDEEEEEDEEEETNEDGYEYTDEDEFDDEELSDEEEDLDESEEGQKDEDQPKKKSDHNKSEQEISLPITQKWVSKRVQMKMNASTSGNESVKDNLEDFLDQDNQPSVKVISKNDHLTVSKSKLREDLYGRMVDELGNVVEQSSSNKPRISFEDVGAVDALTNKLRGLLNRLTVKTIPFVVEHVEEIYKNHSNNLVARCLWECIDVLIVKNRLIASQKLCTETVMLISALHSHIGEEVSGNLLHNLLKCFDHDLRLLKETPETFDGKELENLLLLLCLFYTANIVGDDLIYDILNKFVEIFCPKSIELILFVLKLVGYLLRKDNVSSMKEFILKAQQKASQFDKQAMTEKKVVFLLDALTHIRNNNSLKMDLSDIKGIVTIDKQAFRNEMKSLYKDLNVTPLPGKYNEILRSNRWFVQSGELLEQSIKRRNEMRQERAIPTFNEKLCKKMQLTTPFRKLIFKTLISCEDYVDCSQKLIQIGKKKHFEVTQVCAHVGLSEKTFNPFYAHLFRYLSHVDRNFKRGVLFVIRDKITNFEELSVLQQKNLTLLTSELLQLQVLPLIALKCIDFKDMTDLYQDFFSQTLKKLFNSADNPTLAAIFQKLPKKDSFATSIKLFVNMFLGVDCKNRLKQIKENNFAADKIF